MRASVLASGLLACSGAAVLPGPPPEIFPDPPPRAEARVVLAERQAADPTLLRLEAAVFDPVREGVPDFAGRLPAGPTLRSATECRGSYYLVQFSKSVDSDVRRSLARSGFEILGYVPNRALVVRLPGGRPGSMPQAPPGARFFDVLDPGYKMSAELYRSLGDLSASPSLDGGFALDAWLFRDEDPTKLVAAVLRHFPSTRVDYIKRSQPPGVRLTAPEGDARRIVGALLRDPAVQYVSEHFPLELHNDSSVWIGQSYDREIGPIEAAAPEPALYTLSATIWSHGLLGEGQVVAVGDTGLEYEMCRFRDPLRAVVPQSVVPPGALSVDPAHRKILAYNAPSPSGSTTDDSFRHGTHTAGSVAGDDLAHLSEPGSAGHDHGDGMAPLAKIVFEDLSTMVSSACSTNIAVGSIQDLLAQEYAAGARISSNSWGSSGGGNGAAFEIDSACEELEQMLVVFSAGNNGASGITAQARCKNCLVVGASENYDASFADEFGILDPENMTAFSGQGPTPDGRIKPDVVAPGFLVRSARFPVQYFSSSTSPACTATRSDVCFPSFGGCYVTDTSQDCHSATLLGTSMSTPVTAGLAALAREYFVKGFHPGGQTDPNQAHAPTAALLKAVLIHGARNMTGRVYDRRGGSPTDFGLLAEAPSEVQGWGRVLLDDALYFAGEGRLLAVVDLPQASGLATGEVVEVDTSTAGNETLKATLVWSDPPGQPFASAFLVDDLDLILEGPGGVLYRGNQWTLDTQEVAGDRLSMPGAQGKDAVNNVEVIRIPSPAAGPYTVRVVAVDVPGGAEPARQGFALVLSGALTACTTAEPPANVAIGGSSATAIGLTWSATPGAVGYEILRNATSCGDPMSYAHKVTVPAEETTYADAAVVSGETYHYAVRAVMSPGCRTADSACVSGSLQGPAPVPDGSFGQPMIASRADALGSALDIQWDVLTCPAPGYHLLWGDLSTVAATEVGGGACGLGAGSFAWTDVPAGDLWFLVVSDDAATVEGSWGSQTDGQPRGGGVVSGLCGLTVRTDGEACP